MCNDLSSKHKNKSNNGINEKAIKGTRQQQQPTGSASAASTMKQGRSSAVIVPGSSHNDLVKPSSSSSSSLSPSSSYCYIDGPTSTATAHTAMYMTDVEEEYEDDSNCSRTIPSSATSSVSGTADHDCHHHLSDHNEGDFVEEEQEEEDASSFIHHTHGGDHATIATAMDSQPLQKEEQASLLTATQEIASDLQTLRDTVARLRANGVSDDVLLQTLDLVRKDGGVGPPPPKEDKEKTEEEARHGQVEVESKETAPSVSATGTVDGAEYLRQELQRRVQTEPELFEWVRKAALDGMWYWDLENSENEWFSPEFKELFGYEDHEVPNKSSWWQENIFPEDKVKAIAGFQDHVTNGAPFNSIVRYKHRDGSTVWVRCRGLASFNDEGKPVRMLGAHSDVTPLMQVQEELKKKEAVLDMLCTTSLDGFWDWNMKTNENFLSVRWKKCLGYEDHELENTADTWKSLLHPDDVPKAFEAVRRHLEEGAPYSEVLRYIRKDGSIAHMLAQGVAQKDENGEWCRMFGTHTDVSYLEEARAARLANQAKSTFLATMSHEIRTPLNAVLGMAQVLMGTELTGEQLDCVSTLHNSGKHLLSVINDILDFSQIETGNITIAHSEFSIQEAARDVVAALHLEATNKNIDLTFATSICVGSKFLGDPERIKQIVFNLIGNAIKFTSVGSVKVTMETEEHDGLYGVLVKVRDTGCGMTQDQHQRIFDDFTQASSEIRHLYGGSGLGLSISKKLVAAMGGTIGVDSEVGKGSTFSFWVPGFVPQTVRPDVGGSGSGTVLVYGKTPAQVSVASAIQACGLHALEVSSVQELQTELNKATVQAVSISSQSSGCAEIQDLMDKNTSVSLLVVGKGIERGFQERYASRFRTVPVFPTSDEVKAALSPRRTSKTPQLNAFCLGNPSRDLRLLLAEDNKINVKVMLKLLSRFPCSVEVACNGVEAVQKAKQGKFDLILMDMIMPEMDGVDATKAIRQTDKETPIIALTANATTDDRDSCIEAGMVDFLTKPISLDVLRETLNRISSNVSKQEALE